MFVIPFITGDSALTHQLASIHSRASSTQSDAFAAGTKANMRSHLNSYLAFCNYFSLVSFPLTCSNLLPFLQVFSESVTSYAYVSNVLSTIKTVSHMLGHSIPHVTSIQLSLFMSGSQRKMGMLVHQKLPLTPVMLSKMYSCVDFNDSFQVCVWSTILFMFFTFFRKSNVLPHSPTSFDPCKQVTRSSIVISPDSSFMLVKVTWSKTIQFRQRTLDIPVSSVPGSTLCPVSSYLRLCTLVPAFPHSPAFCYIVNNSLVPLVYSVFVNQLRFWLKCIGVKSTQLYSSHSLRRGGATWAFQSGVTPELIKLQGDWQSDCYLRYVQVNFSRKLSTTSMMAANILSTHL